MADSTFSVSHFLGGEISKAAQGRFDKPDYRFSLKKCLNAIVTEIGNWTRRPGTRHAGHTRGGAPGRILKFDFKQSSGVTAEFTDGFVRFRSGVTLVAGNDARTVANITTASPAVLQLFDAVTWATGDTVVFQVSPAPLLHNRQFKVTKSDSTDFLLTDALTGAAIDGSTLGPLAPGGIVRRVHELATVYTGGQWSGLRMVQAETSGILLTSHLAPQILTVPTPPAVGVDPVFAIGPAILNDGPYLDPFTNGVQVTPNALSGIISLAVSFVAYSATKAYSAGAFVSTGGVNYVSLADQNVGNAPAGLAPWWATTPVSAAINNGRGFLGSDTGRLVRLFSEPPTWSSAATYGIGDIRAYNPSGIPGAALYYSSLTNPNLNHAPGSDLTNWLLIPSGAALWTWGKITGLSNAIDVALPGSVAFGDMTSGGGVNAAFDGVLSQSGAASASKSISGGALAAGSIITLSSYVGKNYSGATDQIIKAATVYPPNDQGIAGGSYVINQITILVTSPVTLPPTHGFLSGLSDLFGTKGSTSTIVSTSLSPFVPSFVLNLRGKASVPASASDGVLLGTSGTLTNTSAPVTILSSDLATAWKYVWIEQVTTAQIGGTLPADSYTVTNAIAEVSFLSPVGTGTGSGVNVEILGPALPYTTVIPVWRLGAYSDTTGWPTCGTYHEGRLWLGGAIDNRFDACVSNGIAGSVVNFAPTDQNGVVATNAAITYTLNSDGVNPMFWMKPDLQGVVMGTQAGEWLVQAATAGAIAANNITARRITKHGSSNIEPVRTEHANIFVKRYARKLLEYFADAYSGKFSAPNLADKAEHRVSNGIAEIAYTEAVTPVVWGRDTAGALFGVTYRRTTISTAQPPDFYAWHGHTLGSGRVVESLCGGPSVGGDLDALTMITNDPVTNIRHVEIMTDVPGEDTPLGSAWFLDNAVTPGATRSSTAAVAGAPLGGLTISGLWHLNGETVQVFAGGLDCGDRGDNSTTFTDFVVSNGSVFVPYGDSVIAGPGRGLFTQDFVGTGPQIVVGFTYNSDGQLVRPMSPADSGARNGPAFAKLSRSHRYGVQLINTLGMIVGANFAKQMYPAIFRNDRGDTLGNAAAFTGIHQDALRDGYTYDDAPCWRVSRPYPATVAAIGTNLATQDQ